MQNKGVFCCYCSGRDDGFGENGGDFTRNSLCPYGAISPHSLMPCLLTDQIQNLTSCFRKKDFLRICSCPYGESSPYSLEPCLMMDQNFADNF